MKPTDPSVLYRGYNVVKSVKKEAVLQLDK